MYRLMYRNAFQFFFIACPFLVLSQNEVDTKSIMSSESFHVNWYGIHIEADPTKRFIKANVESKIITKKTTDAITWDFTHVFKVDSILHHQQKLSFVQKKNNKLVVQLPSTAMAGSTIVMDIYYHGVPPKEKIADNDQGYAFINAQHSGQPVLFIVNEPYGAMQWLPNHNTLDDKADSIYFFIKHPAKYKASANGRLISETKVGDMMTTHFSHHYPIASYLIAFAISNYTVIERTTRGQKEFTLITYAYPEDAGEFEKNLDELISAMEKFAELFGEYPFIKDGYIQTQVSGAGGMEHQANTFVDESDISLQNHELAHQWFGNKVTHSTWSNLWLKEGMANYCADYLYPTLLGAKDNAQANVNQWVKDIISSPKGMIWAKDSTNINRLFDDRLTYIKPAMVFRMLHKTLGDSLFFSAMKNYLKDPKLAYGFAGTKQLQQHAENVSGKSLTYFFDQWVYAEGYPSITLQWIQDVNQNLILELSQKTSHASVKFYGMELPVLLKGKSQQKFEIIAFDADKMKLTIPDPGFLVVEIEIDPEHGFITANNKVIKNNSLKP